MICGMDELIGTAEACRILDCHPSTVSRRVANSELAAAHKLPGDNGAYVFSRAEVEKLAAKLAADKASA